MRPPTLSPTARRALTAALGTITFCLVFTGLSLRPRAVPWYDPIGRQWAVVLRWPTPAQPGMDWYGRLLVASATAVGVAGAVHLVTARVRSSIPADSFLPMALAINTLMAFWLCAFVYVWTLGHRELRPTPPMAFERTSPVPPRPAGGAGL